MHTVNDALFYKNFNFQRNEVYYLNGYWQSEKFFYGSRSEILNSITLPISHGHDFQESCSLHIRRGDYLNLQHVHPVLKIDYYHRALDILKPSGKVFICSNDIECCKQNFDAND